MMRLITSSIEDSESHKYQLGRPRLQGIAHMISEL